MLDYYNSTGRGYWRILTEAVQILYHHPNQIVRHEAAFILGDFPYRKRLERNVAVRHLVTAFKRDPSVVAKHESVEAAGEIFCEASVSAAAHLAKMLRFGWEHPDVLKTAEEAFENILDMMRQKGGYDTTIKELLSWRNPALKI